MQAASRFFALAFLCLGAASASRACDKPLYLTFDTGHMEIAPLVAQVLNKHQVKATFFLANEPTKPFTVNGTSLDSRHAAWWKARVAEGHQFGSHTWDHLIYQRTSGRGEAVFRYNLRNQPVGTVTLDEKQYCEQLRKPAEWFRQTTGAEMSPIYRAPGGNTSPQLLAWAKSCGFAHVGWPKSGWSRDETSSEQFPNAVLLKQSLAELKSGDIILAHLGIWSRRDPWAPAVLDPLISGLKAQGFCFKTLKDHPEWPEFKTVQFQRGY
jgi:peptidoglycan-N-acetylmuramic acid deacetylase